jgi:hypothetical protein
MPPEPEKKQSRVESPPPAARPQTSSSDTAPLIAAAKLKPKESFGWSDDNSGDIVIDPNVIQNLQADAPTEALPLPEPPVEPPKPAAPNAEPPKPAAPNAEPPKPVDPPNPIVPKADPPKPVVSKTTPPQVLKPALSFSSSDDGEFDIQFDLPSDGNLDEW